MTIYQLANEVTRQINKGNGNKEIFISRDDKGNGYHYLYYAFVDNEEDMKILDVYEDIEEYSKCVILG